MSQPFAKRWNLAPPAPPDLLNAYVGMSPLVAQILYNRGLADPLQAVAFLSARDTSIGRFLSYKRGSNSNIDRAIGRLRNAIARKERIAVYGDFDADGVTSTVLLVQTLTALGASVEAYIPHRVDEGYGLNAEALLKLARSGVKVVVTVDCGIRSVEDVVCGNAYGLDIIITDHHSLGPEIPNAHAVINPKCEDTPYTEPMLAGVGVAYRLAEALIMIASKGKDEINGLHLDHLLDLVAIGTVADLAPMNCLENRAFVKRGLELLNNSNRVGMRSLMEVARLEPGTVNAQSIGFTIGPRINAAGRLKSAMIAYDLLSTTDPTIAITRAHELHDLNTQRQELTREAQDLIRQRLEANGEDESSLIFEEDDSFLPGIVGLVAGRLVNEYFKPAVIVELGEIESRASCRSIPEFDITQALDQCADLLVRHGGHAQAAGFTVKNENIPHLKRELGAIADSQLGGQALMPVIAIDAEIPLDVIRMSLLDELAQLEPTGHHHTLPIFASNKVRVASAQPVGQDGKHMKLRLHRDDDQPLECIAFNYTSWRPDAGDLVDIAYSLELNEWNGQQRIQLHLADVRPAEREATVTVKGIH